TLRAVRRRKRDRAGILRDGARRGPHLPRFHATRLAAVGALDRLRRDERRARAPAQSGLSGGRAGGIRQGRRLYRAPGQALDTSVRADEDGRTAVDGKPDALAAREPATRGRDDDRPRRLPSGEHDLASERIPGAGGGRLGVGHARPPAVGPSLPLSPLLLRRPASRRYHLDRLRELWHSRRGGL